MNTKDSLNLNSSKGICICICTYARTKCTPYHSFRYTQLCCSSSGGGNSAVTVVFVAIYFYHCTFSERNRTHKISLGCVYRSFFHISVFFHYMQLPYDFRCDAFICILLHTQYAKTIHTRTHKHTRYNNDYL